MTNSEGQEFIYNLSNKVWNIKQSDNDSINETQSEQPSYLESLIGQTVGFIYTISEILPATVLGVADEEIKQLDLQTTFYQQVKETNVPFDRQPYMREVPKAQEFLKVRFEDPAVAPDGRPRLPQFGKLTPGTWFDLRPYTFQIVAVKFATEESPQQQVTMEPNPDYRVVYETVRELKKSYNRVEVMFGRRKS
jgi:hypothetical protein